MNKKETNIKGTLNNNKIDKENLNIESKVKNINN